ncbi:MAG: hypothetical protein ABFQ95_01160 [Pseudomonadota bacterium]
MNINPTLEVHPELHQEFHFAPDTQASGCCCFWKAKPVKGSEYTVNAQNELVSKVNLTFTERVIAEQKLAELIKMKFDDDPIQNDKAFERLRLKINDDLASGDPITDERLAKFVEAIHELKSEISDHLDGDS